MSLLGSLIGPVTGLLDKFIPDKDLKNQLAHDIATMAEDHMHEEIKMQMEVNKQEAAHKSLFVAGWRPFIGWVCGLGMASNFLLVPFANFGLMAFGNGMQLPMLDLEIMMPVLMGMLGLGAMRSYEKKNNVARNR
jgi:hypothetical protein